jgi:hypothetical protein
MEGKRGREGRRREEEMCSIKAENHYILGHIRNAKKSS